MTDTRIRLAAITLLGALLPVTAFAQEPDVTAVPTQDAEEELTVIEWPEERRPRMEGKYFGVEIDGPVEKRFSIQSGSLYFIFEDNGTWKFRKSLTPRYSVLMENRDDPNLTFGVSRFGPDEFLASLSEEDWLPYIRSIENDVIPKTITYEHYTGTRRAAPYVLTAWTRKVEYEYPLGEDRVGKTREIFAFIEGELFVFVFSGDKDKIDALRRSHNMLLTRMNLEKDS